MLLYGKKKIEESIRASGSSVTSATTDSETPSPVSAPGLAATRERQPGASKCEQALSSLIRPQSTTAVTTAADR
jgi:hypothetical protein